MDKYQTKPEHLVTRTEAYEMISMDKRMFKSLLEQIDGPKVVGQYFIGSRPVNLYDPNEVVSFFTRFKQTRVQKEESEAAWAVPAFDMRLHPSAKAFLRSQWVNHEITV